MNKLMPLLILLIMGFLIFVSWNNVASYNGNKEQEYNRHIETAEKLISKEVYIDAVKEYEAALELKPDRYDIAMKTVELYEKLEIPSGYASACQSAIAADPTQKEPYVLLADYYIRTSSVSSAYELLTNAREKLGYDKDLAERLKTLMSDYTLNNISYEQVKRMILPEDTSNGFMVVRKDGMLGVLSSGGSLKAPCEYEDIGLPANDLIPVKKNGEYYYIDEDGYRKLVPDEPADYFGTFGNGFAPASFGGTYGYINNRLKKYHFEYEYAGSFAKKLAAVKKDGSWRVINTSFERVGDSDFEEVVLDQYSYCSRFGVFFAKKNGSYALYSKSGKKLSEDFEEVRCFESEQPAAVKRNGKWGFLSIKGELVIGPQYDDAGSFSLGYAPVLINGKWGCVNIDGSVVIEPQFDSLEPFMTDGNALCEIEGEKRYVRVRSFE